MNKIFALEVLTEVYGTSPSYIREYGISTVRDAYFYLSRLYSKSKNKDEKIMHLLDDVSDKLQRV